MKVGLSTLGLLGILMFFCYTELNDECGDLTGNVDISERLLSRVKAEFRIGETNPPVISSVDILDYEVYELFSKGGVVEERFQYLATTEGGSTSMSWATIQCGRLLPNTALLDFSQEIE